MENSAPSSLDPHLTRRIPSRPLWHALAAGLLVLVSGAPVLAGRSDPVDTQSRTGVRLRLDLPRRWTADLTYQHRMVDNLTTYRASYFTLKGTYGLSKRIEALASYRLAKAPEWSSHRYALGLEYSLKRRPWSLSLRPMIQRRTRLEDDDEVGGEGATFLRTRLKLERRITRRLDAYAAVEPFFAFGADYPIDNWRNEIGLQYELAKRVRLEAYYIHRPDYGKSYNRLFHVIGVTLRFEAKIRRSSSRSGRREGDLR